MNKRNAKPYQKLLVAGLCGLGLWAGSAVASDFDRHDRYQRHDYPAYLADRSHRPDHKGERIERRLDRKGDRIERKLAHRAAELRYQGRYAEARRLERKGAQINYRLDRKGERIHRQLDRRDHHGQHYGYVSGHHDDRPRHYPRPHASGVTVAIDLGHLIFRH